MPHPPPVEDNAGLRSFLRNYTEWSFTTLMWALWIYLFLPLLSLILWGVGLPYIYQTLFEEDPLLQLMDLVSRLGWAVLIIFVFLRGWGLYNYYVFGKRNRRKQRPEVSIAELARYFNVPPEEVRNLQHRKETIWTTTYEDMRARRRQP